MICYVSFSKILAQYNISIYRDVYMYWKMPFVFIVKLKLKCWTVFSLCMASWFISRDSLSSFLSVLHFLLFYHCEWSLCMMVNTSISLLTCSKQDVLILNLGAQMSQIKDCLHSSSTCLSMLFNHFFCILDF